MERGLQPSPAAQLAGVRNPGPVRGPLCCSASAYGLRSAAQRNYPTRTFITPGTENQSWSKAFHARIVPDANESLLPYGKLEENPLDGFDGLIAFVLTGFELVFVMGSGFIRPLSPATAFWSANQSPSMYSLKDNSAMQIFSQPQYKYREVRRTY